MSKVASGDGAGSGGLELLPVIQKERDHPCFECTKCCTYVAIEIDEPTTMKEYDYIVWYLYHQGLSVFVDFDDAWFVKFETRCRNLTDAGLCSVYDHRPAICKEFDWRDCENTLPPEEKADKWLFESADAFLEWFEERRPKTFKRYKRYIKKKLGGKEEPELQRVKITDVLPPPPGR